MKMLGKAWCCSRMDGAALGRPIATEPARSTTPLKQGRPENNNHLHDNNNSWPACEKARSLPRRQPGAPRNKHATKIRKRKPGCATWYEYLLPHCGMCVLGAGSMMFRVLTASERSTSGWLPPETGWLGRAQSNFRFGAVPHATRQMLYPILSSSRNDPGKEESAIADLVWAFVCGRANGTTLTTSLPETSLPEYGFLSETRAGQLRPLYLAVATRGEITVIIDYRGY